MAEIELRTQEEIVEEVGRVTYELGNASGHMRIATLSARRDALHWVLGIRSSFDEETN